MTYLFDVFSKNEIKLLKTILRLAKKNNSDKIPLSFIYKEKDDFYFSRLIEKNLIYYEDGGNWGMNLKTLVLTKKGRNFFEYRRKKIKQFLFRSVLTPTIVSSLTTLLILFIVSSLTTLITLFITWLGGVVITK